MSDHAGPTLDDAPVTTAGVPRQLPHGAVSSTDPNAWYRLKVDYQDDHGKSLSGYMCSLATNASTSFWDYVVLRPGGDPYLALRFKIVPDEDGKWARWEIHDDDANKGYSLGCKATGWLYRASAYDVRFRVVDGQLFCNYWDGPMGSRNDSTLVPDDRYVGGDLTAFTCELKSVSG